MNSNLLKAEMVKNGINGQRLAEQIGISESAFYRKMSGASQFNQGEMKKISLILGLADHDILAIFFGQEVS